jgi:hypothetical protein
MTMTEDEARRFIEADKKERKARRKKNGTKNSGRFYRKVFRLISPNMRRGRDISIDDMGLWLQMSGLKHTSIGPACHYGVEVGYLERVAKGVYRLTGNDLPAD